MAVCLVSTRLLTEADGAHLQQPGSERAGGLRVSLSSAKNDDAVGFECESVHVSHGPGLACAKLAGFHRGAYTRIDALIRNTKTAENLRLPFGDGAAMTSHRRNNEGLAAAFFDGVHNPCKQVAESSDSAA